MAKHKKKPDRPSKVDIDLTAMIDVVFQLIIFFMVVTQITTQDNVNLRLPDAIAANKEPPTAKQIFTVHIAPVNQIATVELPTEFGWFCYGEPGHKSVAEMKNILAKIANMVDVEGKGYYGKNDQDISENMIYVRCDARCPAGHFAQLIELMVEARMYKIKVGIMKDPTSGD